MSFSTDISSGFKVTPSKIERNSAMTKKKAESPAIKPSPAPTPTHLKKANGPPLPKSKSRVGRENNTASLHMSYNLGCPTNSSSMTRKSLIMEKVGDKDIVRQAFKTFQIRSNGSSRGETSNTPKQAPLPHRKGNEG